MVKGERTISHYLIERLEAHPEDRRRVETALGKTGWKGQDLLKILLEGDRPLSPTLNLANVLELASLLNFPKKAFVNDYYGSKRRKHVWSKELDFKENVNRIFKRTKSFRGAFKYLFPALLDVSPPTVRGLGKSHISQLNTFQLFTLTRILNVWSNTLFPEYWKSRGVITLETEKPATISDRKWKLVTRLAQKEMQKGLVVSVTGAAGKKPA